MPDPFTGERVRLRATTEDDFSTFREWFSDPEILAYQSSGALVLRSPNALEEMFDVWELDKGLPEQHQPVYRTL